MKNKNKHMVIQNTIRWPKTSGILAEKSPKFDYDISLEISFGI